MELVVINKENKDISSAYPNGDFEDLCDNNVSEIKDLETEISPDGVSLSWSITSEDYEEIRLYEKSEDTYQFRGTIGKNIDNIVTRTIHSNNVGVVITDDNVSEYLSYMDKYKYFTTSFTDKYYFEYLK